MILDAENQFSDSQALSGTAGVTLGSNVIDLGVDRSIGNGEPMAVIFNVEVTALVSDGDEDYTFDVEYSSDSAQTTDVQTVGRRIFQSGTPAVPAQDADLLVAGFTFAIAIPPTGLSESARYIGIRHTTLGTTVGYTGSAYLVPMSSIQAEVLYPDNITIS